MAGGLHLHSAYNPEREAERFVQGIKPPFMPQYVLVTGAGRPYTVPYLKKEFPGVKVCAVQYTKDFSDTDFSWDKVFYFEDPEKSVSPPLSDQIFNYLGDEGTIACFFTSWRPSERAFPEEYKATWKEIKKAVLKSRTVLQTRTYFGRRWTKNAVRLPLFAERFVSVTKGDVPVIVCASGRSLESSVPFLKEFRDSFFLIAVSSAYNALASRGIRSDICVSTDGGYWAKKHLSHMGENDCVLALAPEAACPARVLESVRILALDYSDGPGTSLLKSCRIPAMPAVRCGTVSGTAVALALSITAADVFVCGLDLAPNAGHSHTQPNELETTDSLTDRRLHTQETRLCPRTFKSPAMDTYREWFSSSDFGGRVFRLSAGYKYNLTLGSIKDVDWDFFKKRAHERQKADMTFPKLMERAAADDFHERRSIILSAIKAGIGGEEWLRTIMPADYILYERSLGGEDKSARSEKIDMGIREFYPELTRGLAP